MHPASLRLIYARVRRAAIRAALTTAMALTPALPRIVVHGAPDTEENALAAVLASTQVFNGETIWMVDDAGAAHKTLRTAQAAYGFGDVSAVKVVKKARPRALVAFISAELVLHTHGVLSSPRTTGRRAHVFLGHGNGPKRIANQALPQVVSSDLAAGNAPVWGLCHLDDLRMPRERLRLAGNPRQDALARGCTRAQLVALGIDPMRPLVMWMPTYRKSSSLSPIATTDGDESALGASSLARALVEAHRAAGIQLIVKPHPLAADDARALGAKVLVDEDLWAAGVTTYQLVGQSKGLISDYSSIWTEALEAEKSVGLFCPDYDAYASTRGLNHPELREVAGAIMLTEVTDIEEFVASIVSGAQFRRTYSEEVRDRLGCATTFSGNRTYQMFSDLQRALASSPRWKRIASRIDAESLRHPSMSDARSDTEQR